MNSKRELERLVLDIGQQKNTQFTNYRISNVIFQLILDKKIHKSKQINLIK
jgi:hypothetical protein